MALSQREILVVLRARDEASRVFRGLAGEMNSLSRQQQAAIQAQMRMGMALTTIGIGMSAAGVAGLSFFNNAIDASIEYTNAASKTLTQVDGLKVSLQELKDIGLDVARTIPVPFEQIQEELYDIFSSMDVNLPESKRLIKEFSRAAVAGSSDLSTAGRATIAILNAWKLGAGDVNHVNDVMFQLVRKGVGTYEEFASSIGKSIPSAVKAGQSVETLAGMLAFLTRNGLSTAMASTSAARALDAIANPKTVKKMEEMGLKVRDASGNFRPLTDILGQLNDKVKNMPAPARNSFITELLKGSGGTIQARRFFDTVFTNFDEFGQRVGEMQNSAGAMDDAYKIMFDSPQAKIQLLTNRYMAMKTEIGDQLLPVKLQLITALSKLLEMWNNLSPRVQKLIVLIGGLVSVIAVIAGIVITVAGLFLLWSAAAAAAGTTIAAMAAPIAIIIAIIVAIVAAVVLVIKYHKQIWSFMKKVWSDIAAWTSEAWAAIWEAIGPTVIAIWNTIKSVFGSVVTFLSGVWNAIKTFAIDTWNSLWALFGPNLIKIAQATWNGIVGVVQRVWTELSKFGAVAKAVFDGWVRLIKEVWATVLIFGDIMRDVWQGTMGDIFRWFWEHLTKPILTAFYNFLIMGKNVLLGFGAIVVSVIANTIGPVFELFGNIIGRTIQFLRGLIEFIVGVFTGNWSMAWQGIKDTFAGTFMGMWDFLVGIVKVIWGVIKGFVKGIVDWFKWLWNVLVGHSIIPDLVLAIAKWLLSLPGRILGGIAGFAASLVGKFVSMAASVVRTVADGIGNVVRWYAGLPGKVFSALSGLTSKLVSRAKESITGFYNGVTSTARTVFSWFGSIGSKIKGAIGSLSGLLTGAGRSIISGLYNGIKRKFEDVKSFVGGIGSWIADHKGPLDYDRKLLIKNGRAIMSGLERGLKDNMPQIQTDLGRFTASLAPQQRFGAPVVPSVAGAGGGPNVEMTVITQEIDPRKHSADLAWEIARKLGG